MKRKSVAVNGTAYYEFRNEKMSILFLAILCLFDFKTEFETQFDTLINDYQFNGKKDKNKKLIFMSSHKIIDETVHLSISFNHITY